MGKTGKSGAGARKGKVAETGGKSGDLRSQGEKKAIEQYEHKDKKRVNNPPAGLVTKETEAPEAGKKTYAYDPNLDPRLEWAGRAERLSFAVPTVSLHVHERIDPRTIIEAVRAKNGHGEQPSLFESSAENPPLREAIDFYRHPHNWTNRLIAGDSLLVMNSLLEKEGMAGKVQMVFIDPPYGIKFGSNFQPFVNNREVKEGKDDDLTQEPEMIKAFRDTWELGIHSYLTYLRDRLWLAKELLDETGSCFVQISDENVHRVRELMDEVFGSQSFMSLIPFRKKTMPLGGKYLEQMADYLVWYARAANPRGGRGEVKYRALKRHNQIEGDFHYCWYELPNGARRRMSREQVDNHSLLPEGARVYRLKSLEPSGPMESGRYTFEFEGNKYPAPANGYGTTEEGMKRLVTSKRIQPEGNRLTFIMYADESAYGSLTAPWSDTVGADSKVYAVQTNTEVLKRCILLTTDPGDLVLDITCGSGATAYVAEHWGRRWITCDTSRVAVTLTKQRLMTATFDHFKLASVTGGVGSGFVYKTVPSISVGAIANNPEILPGMSRKAIDSVIQRHAEQETLYDQPEVDNSKVRVTGPFTVEAVPAPVVRAVGQVEEAPGSDESLARSGATLRARDWRDELLKTGVRGRGGQRIGFTRVESLAGTRWLHADAETKEGSPKRVVVSFGPEHAPLTKVQVEEAWKEARTLNPRPAMVLFAAFQFDPEAAKDIDEVPAEKAGMVFLKVQMNTDLLTEDLKKKRASNESFWLVGQPDVELRRVHHEDTKNTKTHEGRKEEEGKWVVEVKGFDYYNPKTGAIESGDTGRIAMWMLDTDYDGRSVFPRQVFFPMAGDKEGWARLAKNLRAEIDGELIEAYRGTVSLAFEAGEHKRAAVKIVDDRGIESLKIVELE